MYVNYWLERSNMIIEKEVILVKPSHMNKAWLIYAVHTMPSIIPAACPAVRYIHKAEDFGEKIGTAHHLRMTKFGIEAIIKVARRYLRYNYYVLKSNLIPFEPFWVIFHKDP